MDKILQYFIREPEREFYVRELAKLLKKSPTTISKYLQNLKKQGILISRKKFNHLLFKADIENYLFNLEKLSFNLKKLHSSGLIDYLTEKFNHPEAIVLFGSFAKAKNIEQSDVDLLIITSLKKEISLSQYEKKIGHKVQLFLHSFAEIDRMKTKNKELLNNFIDGIVLQGNFEVFK